MNPHSQNCIISLWTHLIQ